jgi:hypothetical protein
LQHLQTTSVLLLTLRLLLLHQTIMFITVLLFFTFHVFLIQTLSRPSVISIWKNAPDLIKFLTLSENIVLRYYSFFMLPTFMESAVVYVTIYSAEHLTPWSSCPASIYTSFITLSSFLLFKILSYI